VYSYEYIIVRLAKIVNIENNIYSNEYKCCVIIFSMENKFAEWLMQRLDEKGWSQSDLARRANIARGTISNILNGTRAVGPDTCLSIAKALNYPPEVVFRKAGILPPQDNQDETTQQAVHIFTQLSPHYQDIALDLLRSLSKQQTNNEENPGEVSPATHKA
jgi:transcriptional regulator with XRE-family HTH domain